MKAVNYESFMKKRKRTVEFLAVFLAVLTLITALQVTWVVSYAEDTHDSVESYLAMSGANDWQIVDGQYSGRAADNKTTYSSDGSVRVQKNVIPTDRENEFYVYTSIDVKEVFTETLYKEFFESQSAYHAVTSKKIKKASIGKVISEEPPGSSVTLSRESLSSGKKGVFTIYSSNGDILARDVTMYWSKANNITVYLTIGNGKYLILAAEVSKDETNDYFDVTLDQSAENTIKDEIKTTTIPAAKLNQVTDIFDTNSYVQYDTEFGIKGDYKDGSGFSNNTLTWKPNVKSNITPTTETQTVGNTKTTTNWYCNVAELVYKVKLDVTKPGFESCGKDISANIKDKNTAYSVTSSSTLSYDTNGSLSLTPPKVRGLLYEFEFDKIAADTSEKLSGANFSLSGSGVDKTSTSDNNGKCNFNGLPMGIYTITESNPPEGYAKSTNKLSVDTTDGYTANPSKFEFSSNSVYGRLKNDDNNKQIKNDPVTNVKITKEVVGEGANKDKKFSFKYSTQLGNYQNHAVKSGTFKLSDGDTETLELGIGDNLILQETDNEDYTVKVNGEDYSAQNGITITKDMEITVTNTRKTATVTVNKIVEGNIEKDSFSFSYSYETADGITGNGSIDVEKDSSNSFEVPTGANVTLTEESSEDYEIKSVEGANETPSGNSYTFTVGSNDVSVTVTNEPVVKNTTITVKKVVTGNMGDKDKEFDFNAIITKNGTTTTESFKLSNNGEETLTVPVGASLVISEDTYNGYTTISKFGSTKGDSTITIDSVPQNGGTVTFTNEKEESIETGITLDNAPYVITVFSAVSLLAIMALKRRRHMEK